LLFESGVDFDDVAIYRKAPTFAELSEYSTDFAAFTSSSGVEGFATAAAGLDFKTVNAVCIGKKTAASAQSYGMEASISAEATIDSMIIKILEMYAHGD
jgi:uroporphyrinogen III methyltransferase/synthase